MSATNPRMDADISDQFIEQLQRYVRERPDGRQVMAATAQRTI